MGLRCFVEVTQYTINWLTSPCLRLLSSSVR